MHVRIKAPKTGLTAEEVSVTAWLKQPGQAVRTGEPVVEVESEKVTIEVPSPVDGVLERILASQGHTVPVGGDLGIITTVGTAPAAPEIPMAGPISAPAPPSDAPGRHRVPATPAARRLAREHGVDLALLYRDNNPVTVHMVEAHVRERRPAVADALPPAAAAPGAEPPVARQPLNPLRRTIARRMTASFHAAPPFFLAVEADVSRLVALREELADAVAAVAGSRLSYTDLLLVATAGALQEHPQLNASWAEDGIDIYQAIHLGVAVDVPGGLVVPVVREPHRMPLSQVVRERSRLVEAARAGRLRPEDVAGGTFTLSNLGPHGVDLFMPILNPPQAAILGTGRIAPRAVPGQEGVCFRQIMHLCLVVDHRVADGAEGARFLDTLREILARPYRLLVQ